MKELDISMIQDLYRLFDYHFIINDGQIISMISKDEDKNTFYIMQLGG